MKGTVKSVSLWCGLLLILTQVSIAYAYTTVSNGLGGPGSNSNIITNSPYISNQAPNYGGLTAVPAPSPPALPANQTPPQQTTAEQPANTFNSPSGQVYSGTTLAPVKSSSIFPEGCVEKGYAMRDKNLLLADGFPSFQQGVFLLVNISNDTVVVNHPENQGEAVGASAGWYSKLHSKAWSAVSIDQADFALSCLSLASSSMAYVSCDQVLRVCGYPPQSASGNSAGGYWIEEDKALGTVVDAVKGRGFQVKPQPAGQKLPYQPPQSIQPIEQSQTILTPVNP